MKYQSSTKKMVQVLVEQCFNLGIKHVIISPGSRNAPLIISFDNHPAFTTYSIPDERSAAFYALGMARQLNEPVALVCTSGTAVLNYAPALTEAFYQEIPLIAITADRPPELIDQEDGQTIRQHNIFNNHIKFSTTLPVDEQAESIEIGRKDIHEALLSALSVPKGPVHINIPFREPLYETGSIDINELVRFEIPNTATENYEIEFLEIWNKSNKILLLVGVHLPDEELNLIINRLADEKNVVVLAPPTSNLSGKNVFNSLDGLFLSIKETEATQFQPDLLITLGGPVISKNAKLFLRGNKPNFHIDVDCNPMEINTYQCLTHKIVTNSKAFVNFVLANCEAKTQTYTHNWQQKNKEAYSKSSAFQSELPWVDLTVYIEFFKSIEHSFDLHLGNSTPVRYAELFSKHPKLNYYCNRGTSGIDGSTSTAAGAAIASAKAALVITGDISFFYDSNAFWNAHVPKNLKIILINNGGGNIFKVISGYNNKEQVERHFVTHQTAKAQKICEAFGIDYLSASNKNELHAGFQALFASENCTVLEIFTPSDASAQAFKDFITVHKK